MSLINDALKKAERERAGSTPSTPPIPTVGQHPSPSRKAPLPTLLLIGGGTVLGLTLAFGAWLLWPSPPANPPSESSAPSSGAIAQASPPVPVAPSISPSSAPESPRPTPAPEPAAPILPTPAAPAATAAAPAAETPAAPVAPQAELPVVKTSPANVTPPTEPAGPRTSFIRKVESFRVAGIRFAGAESKVIMNDRVHRIGDIVDPEQGIRLTAVTANSLTFVDATGATYTRQF